MDISVKSYDGIFNLTAINGNATEFYNFFQVMFYNMKSFVYSQLSLEL